MKKVFGYKRILIGFLIWKLVIALLFPSAVKFAHVFEDHEHISCISPDALHLHELDIDCEFYKFNLKKTLSLSQGLGFNSTTAVIPHSTTYYWLKGYTYSAISYYLRGPPVLV